MWSSVALIDVAVVSEPATLASPVSLRGLGGRNRRIHEVVTTIS